MADAAVKMRRVDRVYQRLHRVFMPPGRQQSALDRFGVRAWTAIDVWVYRRLGLSLAARMMHTDVLLLRTIGRRTAQLREALVAYTTVDGDYVIGGGNWGWDRDPGWLYNIGANPDVDVVIGRDSFRMRGTILEGDEEAAARDALAAAFPHSQIYVTRRVRRIPTVRLQPR